MSKSTVEFIEVGSRVFYISENWKICTGKVNVVNIKSQNRKRIKIEYVIEEDDICSGYVNRTSKAVATSEEELINKLKL